MKSSCWKLLSLLNLFFLFALALTGCGLNPTASNGIEGDDGTTSNIPSTENFQVDVNTSSTGAFQIKISRNGDGSTDCIAVEGEDILCVVDMYEMDMYMRGYTLNVAFNPDLCKYSGFYPYYFNFAPIGTNPSAVFYNENEDGDLIAPGAYLGDLAAETDPDIYYLFGSTWYTHEELYGEPAFNSGDLRCPWDYSSLDSDYPNCCSGDYTLYTVSDGELSNADASWTGKRGNCFDGPGIRQYDQVGDLDSDGLPVYQMQSVDPTEGATQTFAVDAPFDHYSAVGAGQIYASNYYKASEHTGSPAVPAATRLPSIIYSGYEFLANTSAHFQYDCYDEAMEVNARIRVVAREWNDYASFAAFLANPSSVSDPDDAANESGTETSPDQDSEDSSVAPNMSYINDFADWKDVTENRTSSEMSFPATSAVVGSYFGLDATVANALVLGRHSDYWGFHESK